MKESASEVRWLTLGSGSTYTQSIEYAVKGPLYAASAVFTAKAGAGGVRVEGQIQGSMTLVGKWRRNILVEPAEDGVATFALHREEDPLKSQGFAWRLSADGLRGDDDRQISREALSRLPSKVLSAAQIPFALADTWSDDATVMGCFFVIDRRIYALRVEKVGANKMSGRVCKAGSAAGLETWESMPWSSAKASDMIWDPATRTVKTIKVSAGPLGWIDVPLTRNQRS